MLDVRTLVVAAGFTCVMLSVTMLASVGELPATLRRSLRTWAVGLMVQPAGWFLFAFRGRIPDVLSVLCGNTLVIAGVCIYVVALAQFQQRPQQRHPPYVVLAALVALTVAWVTITVWVFPNPELRVIGMTAISIAVYALSAHAAFPAASGSRQRSSSHWIVAMGFAAGVPILLLRLAWHLGISPTPAPASVALSSLWVDQLQFLYSMAACMVTSFGFVMMCNDRMNAQLQKLASEDALTGLSNRRRFGELAAAAIGRARASGAPLCALVVDADHFKLINDHHGHAAGDAALRVCAQAFRSVVRLDDVLGRIGGEEFAVVLNDCDAEHGYALAERLRVAVEACSFSHEGQQIPLRVSVGVAQMQPGDDGIETLLRYADGALYQAKQEGRNRVVLERRVAS
ncbi:MAG TPA: GGDEF domain-containing protein [Xanthomonadaceae bacterium]|jgi:diguanylate cyclase (GGDEF)-like protein|nr:GGDEF domain-containing protein [Xanthomonadaceae bacterium]